MSAFIILRCLLLLFIASTLWSFQIEGESLNFAPPFPSGDTDSIAQITTMAQASDWLGPLAPIAISPFFGITILAGVSQFGGNWELSNSFISDNPVLQNPYLFWTFLCLTILTSVPRFTKVSKPFAQAIDQLETYAAIITIILIRVLTVFPGEPTGVDEVTVVHASIFTFSSSVLFCLFATFNIVVINTIKFFFEVMVWLIPIPFIDGLLEIANKLICALLLAVYLWSPTLALCLNFLMLAAGLFVFRWINRRVHYIRNIIWDQFWCLLRPSYQIPNIAELIVFPDRPLGPFPTKARLHLRPHETGWELTQRRLFLGNKTIILPRDSHQLEIYDAILVNRIKVNGFQQAHLFFSKRYSRNLEKLSGLLGIQLPRNTLETNTLIQSTEPDGGLNLP
ncbi:hypothetical protein N9B43_03450 [Mariniblastus sp.]|nr:hypothetical protein [Mariniblastus sp.]